MKEELYIKLLQKKFSDALTSAEKKTLDDWLRQSVDNQLFAKSVQRGWELSEGYTKDLEVDLDADFSILEARLDQSETRVVKMKTSRNWWSIAATILVLVAAGFGISQYLQEDLKWVAQSTTDDQILEFTLSDGSMIYLNQNSNFEYPENFGSKERRVKLTGEAFFEVEHNPNLSFIIEGKYGETTVLGTSFNVRNYDSEEKTIVTVRDGKVRFSPKGSDSKVDLIATEKVIFDRQNGKLILSKDEALVAIKWHSKTFDFIDYPLSSALEEIGQAYNVTFEFENENLKSCPLTSGKIIKKELNQIFQLIETALKVKFIEVDSKKYRVEGGNC